MKLTLFGEAVRSLRMRYDLSMKAMADFMEISSSHLSGIEYGEKRLLQKHVDSVLKLFVNKGATKEELELLRSAAEKSKEMVITSNLKPDARGLVAAFARRLQEGDQPSPEILEWIKKKGKSR